MSWFLFYFLVGTHKKNTKWQKFKKKTPGSAEELFRDPETRGWRVDCLVLWVQLNVMRLCRLYMVWDTGGDELWNHKIHFLLTWECVLEYMCVFVWEVFLKNRNNVFSWLFIVWNNMHYCYKLQYLQTFTVTSLNSKSNKIQ